MMQRTVKRAALIVVVLAAGCANNDYPLTAQERKLYMPIDRAQIAQARDQKMPKIKAETHLAAAKLLEQQGDVVKAITQYRKAIQGDHRLTEAYHRLGVLLSVVGQREEAVTMLRRAVILSPDQPVLHNDLGFALTLQGQWPDAEQAFRKAIAIEPRFARAHINLGLTLSKMDRFAEARDAFLAVLPEPDAYYNLGLMYRSQHKFAEAATAFKHVLAVAPTFSAATAQLDAIHNLIPAKPKATLSPSMDALAYQQKEGKTAPSAPIILPAPVQPTTQGRGFDVLPDATDFALASPFQNQTLRSEVDARDHSQVAGVAPAAPVNAMTEARPGSATTSFQKDPQATFADLVPQGVTAVNDLSPDDNQANRQAMRLSASSEPSDRVCRLREDDRGTGSPDEGELATEPMEAIMSQLNEPVTVARANTFCVADDWSAWSSLSDEAIASAISSDASESPSASLMVMGQDLHEVRDEIDCLEEELAVRLAEREARDKGAADHSVADAWPVQADPAGIVDGLLVMSPLVAPDPLCPLDSSMFLLPFDSGTVSRMAQFDRPWPTPVSDGETVGGQLALSPLVFSEPPSAFDFSMPLPPLDQDMVSLLAELTDPSVDVKRIWTGESEVDAAPYTQLVSDAPCESSDDRPTLASSILESPVQERFLSESDGSATHNTKLMSSSPADSPTLSASALVFDSGEHEAPFEWVARFTYLDDGLSVLLNEARCWDEQHRRNTPGHPSLDFCPSDFVPACVPGVTDTPPFEEDAGISPARRPWPWLHTSDQSQP